MNIKLNLKLYDKKSIVSACYKLSGKFNIISESATNNIDIVEINIEPVDTSASYSESQIKEEFFRVLNNEELRENLDKKFGKIREMIVEEAFKPLKNNGKD
ncbi:MAG: His-Xaa-Ser system protein HxsD [Aeromonadales bacterium]|nr:His-Xaa-Ser system protein HxsD [Aeromonadales bacterium]MDY2889990.1 His-Xaa-Ser system protein HxsD [Succinivibrio sp.]